MPWSNRPQPFSKCAHTLPMKWTFQGQLWPTSLRKHFFISAFLYTLHNQWDLFNSVLHSYSSQMVIILAVYKMSSRPDRIFVSVEYFCYLKKSSFGHLHHHFQKDSFMHCCTQINGQAFYQGQETFSAYRGQCLLSVEVKVTVISVQH